MSIVVVPSLVVRPEPAIVEPPGLQRLPEKPPLHVDMLRGDVRALYVDSGGHVQSLLIDGVTYRVESNEQITKLASPHTLHRRAEAMRRLGHKDGLERTVEQDIRNYIDGYRARPVL